MADFKKLAVSLLVVILCFNSIIETTARAAASPDDDWGNWGSESEEEKSASEEHKVPESHSINGASPEVDDDSRWSWGTESKESNEEPAAPMSAKRSMGSESPNNFQQQSIQKEDAHAIHQVPAVPSPSAAAPDTEVKYGSSGSNYANYNQTCGTGGVTCNPYNNLLCTPTNKCMCQSNPPHTYIRSQEKCYPITNLGERCEFDHQCHEGGGGQHTKCPESKTGTCQCHDAKFPVVEFNKKCVRQRNYNEACETDDQCQSTMKDNSYCAPRDAKAQPDWANATQICQCTRGYVWDNLIEQCLKIADRNGLESSCKSDLQCTAYMGELSRCNKDTKKCDCYDPANPLPGNAIYYSKTHTCYQLKYYNTKCSLDAECEASLSPDAKCLPPQQSDPANNQELTCQCPPGKTCKNSAGVNTCGMVTTIGAAISMVFYQQYCSV